VSKYAWRSALLAGTALAVLPAAAMAETAKEKELEARIAALEAAFVGIQDELETTQAENVKLRGAAAAAQTKTSAEALVRTTPSPAPAPSALASGFTSGRTQLNIGGFIKSVASFSQWDDGDVAANTFGRDFYLPQAIPIGGVKESTDNDFSAKQTRLWLNLDSGVENHTLKGYIETDFQTAPGTQGSERTTNGYDLALRRAYVQYDWLTVGQDWSTFQYTGALPETTDFIGPTEGTVFVRQPLARLSLPVSEGWMFHIAAENPETATATLGAPTLIENDDDSLPDIAARLQYNAKIGELSFSGLVRQLALDNGAAHIESTGYGVSLGGKIFLNNEKRSDIRFMATYGSGIARYVGLNFAPDAVFVPASNDLSNVDTFGTFAALRHSWTPKLRSTLTASYHNASYDDDLSRGSLLGFNDTALSYSGNLFWTAAPGFDVGVEYRRGEREHVSGASGQLDRVEFAAKYSF
jgi:hypothetical protein